MFKFRAVLARTQPFLSRSVRNGATNGSNAEKWSIIMQFAVVDAHVDGGGLHDEDREQGGELVQGQDERLQCILCA
jgi:hypothetical protein